MADVKISALPAAGTLDGTEVLPLVQGGVTKKVTTAGILLQPAGGVNVLAVIASLVAVNSTLLVGKFIIDHDSGIMTIQSLDDGGTNATISCAGFGGAGVAKVNLGGSLAVSLGFGANGNTPQTKAAVNAAAVDPATTMALVNQLRAALIANGICV